MMWTWTGARASSDHVRACTEYAKVAVAAPSGTYTGAFKVVLAGIRAKMMLEAYGVWEHGCQA